MNRDTFRRWGAQLNRIYRVSLVDDETLHETRRYILKPKTILISGILLVLGIIVATSSLIVFTPSIREHIPGYLNPEYEIKQNEMLVKISDLQQDIEERDSMLNVIRGMMDGTVPSGSIPSIPTAAPANPAPQPQSAPVQAVAKPAKDNTASATFVHNPNYGEGRRPSMLRLFLPVEGKVRNSFNRNKGHYGVDIAAKEKAFVKAANGGTVVFAEYSDRDGHVISVSSSDDVLTFYKHNSKILKRTGDFVKAGEVIAVVGNSGENTNGPHLHFEVWRRGIPVDPVPFFEEWQ